MNPNEIGEDELPKQGNSNFLRGTELVGKVVSAKITNVGVTKFTYDGEQKESRILVVSYKDTTGQVEKQFSLNKTNTDVLKKAFGKKPAEWIGQTVNLSSVKKNNPKTGASVDSIVIIA